MKKFLVCALLILCFKSFAYALIMIHPKYVEFDDSIKLQQMILINPNEEETVNYRISLKYLKQNNDGSYTPVPVPEGITGIDLLRYSPRAVTLSPKKSQTIKLLKRLPESLPNGEYYAYITFTKVVNEKPLVKPQKSKEKGFKVELTAIPSISIPVIIRKGNNLFQKAEISKVTKDKNYEKQPMLIVRIARLNPPSGSGEVPASIRGDLSVWLGSKMIGLLKYKYVLVNNNYVDVAVDLSKNGDWLTPNSIAGKKLKVYFTGSVEEDGVDLNDILAETTYTP